MNSGKNAEPVLSIQGKPCYHCGKKGHLPRVCQFHDAMSCSCGKKGHIQVVCRSNMYQFVFTKDAMPFVLISCSSVPKIQLDFSLKCLTDCDVYGSLIIVQKDIKIDIDCFLNLLDNVGVPIVM